MSFQINRAFTDWFNNLYETWFCYRRYETYECYVTYYGPYIVVESLVFPTALKEIPLTYVYDESFGGDDVWRRPEST